MIKLINKKDCVFEHGYILHGDAIVPLDYEVLHELNELECMYQQATYVSNQPDGAKTPSLVGFEFESIADADIPVAVPDTPAIDARVKEALAFLDDMITKEFCEKVNYLIGRLKPLFKFIHEDFIKDEEHGYTDELDLKYVGNPLELTEARIMDMIEFIVKQDDRCDNQIRCCSDCDGEF